MNLRFMRHSAALSAVVLGAACESGTDPEVQHLVDLALDFCSNDVPVWVAYQNQGADWVRLTPNADGTVSFTATNDVALAFVRQDGADYDTEIIFAANTDLESVSGQVCREESGSKTVNGTVAGVVGSQLALVQMSFSSAYLTSAQTSFSLSDLPDRPLDLIATRVNAVATSQSADRIVIRRNQSLVNNATMPVIDFTAPSALVPTAFGIDVTGVAAGEDAFLATFFTSQLETSPILSFTEPVNDGSHTAVGMPQQDLAAGDYHDAFVIAVDQNGATRGVERFFLAPTQQSLTLGAAMGIPDISTASSSPYLRLRAQAPRGVDYLRAMRVDYSQSQQQFSTTRVAVTVTSGFDNTGDWDVTIPDFSGVSGWQNSWGLVDNAGDVEWTVTVFGGRPDLLFGAHPGDGEVVRFASRSSSVSSSVASAFRSGVSAPLPRPFAPSR